MIRVRITRDPGDVRVTAIDDDDHTMMWTAGKPTLFYTANELFTKIPPARIHELYSPSINGIILQDKRKNKYSPDTVRIFLSKVSRALLPD